MQELRFGEMVLQRLLKGQRQHRHTVLSAIAILHSNLQVGEIDIFDAQLHTLYESQTGVIEQFHPFHLHHGRIELFDMK
jgi:hypothetical protein